MIVTVNDMHSVPFAGKKGYCARVSRQWAAAHGLDWLDFVRNGIAAEKLLATGDPMALALVEHARKRHG